MISLIPYCQALFLYDRVLSFCWAQLLAGVAYWVQPMFSCNSTAATPTPDASLLRTNGFVRSGSFSSNSGSRYSLSNEYTRSGNRRSRRYYISPPPVNSPIFNAGEISHSIGEISHNIGD